VEIAKNIEVKNISMPEDDILFYYPDGLMKDIYLSKLKKSNYSLDVVSTGDELLDKLESTKYKYVIYDTKVFGTTACLMSDLIHDTGAIPFVIVKKLSKESSHYGNELLLEMSAKTIEEKLKGTYY